jgi:photosystem II stability/assembly factor-like uncharacterized protein
MVLSAAIGSSHSFYVLHTTDDGTTWVTQTLGAYSALTITCPSTDACLIGVVSDVNPGVIATRDSGTQWTTTYFDGPGVTEGIGCWNASGCVAIGAINGSGDPQTEKTTNDGTSWNDISTMPGTPNLEGISCPSKQDCWTVGTVPESPSDTGSMLATANGGKDWTNGTIPSAVQGITAVSCGAVSVCLAVGTTSSGAVLLGTRPG